MTQPKSLFFILICLVFGSQPVRAQFSEEGYDDYGTFASDPANLDAETRELFGRFFQTTFQLGTGILLGDLGQAYAAGFLGQFKFIYYFDRMWGSEIGVGWGQNQGYYNRTNTKAEIDFFTTMSIVPLFVGFRFGFDPENLARGFSMMNPYLSAQGEFIFRSEKVVGPFPVVTDLTTEQQTFFGPGGSKNDRSIGVNFGGGVEFDVYKNSLFMGLDLRYHVALWGSRGESFGTLGRGGHYLTLLANVTYSY
jgi:hypothetical protein